MGAFAGLDALDVVGPVRAEIFAVWLNHDRIEITGPRAPEAIGSWHRHLPLLR